MKLTRKQKISYFNHLFKVLTRSHHTVLRPLFASMLGNDAVVLDVGGHAGQFTKLFSQLVPHGKVFTFEPSIYSRSILQSMAGLKFLQNVYLLPFGLSDRPEQAVIHTPLKKRGSLGYGLAFVGSTENTQRQLVASEILLSTLDLVVETLAIERVDLIKADIEGSELRMLLGARQTLLRFRPILLLEVSDDALARNGHDSGQLLALLRECGYQQVSAIDIETGQMTPSDMGMARLPDGDYLFQA